MVMWTGINILTRNHGCKAAKPRRGRNRAVDRGRLTTLIPSDKVHRPTSENGIHGPARIAQQRPTATDRELPGARDVNDVGSVGIAQGVDRPDRVLHKTIYIQIVKPI
jgi:hypothetical protein